MRSYNCGVNDEYLQKITPEIAVDIYTRICRSKYFDLEVVNAVQDKRIAYPVYLSLGQESVPAALAFALNGYMLFTQHRCHAYYLAFGGSPEKLRDELLGLNSGTSGGRAGSNCIQNHDANLTMYGHHGLIGENVPQAVGAALGSGNNVLCVFGDGAAEEDYIYPSIGFAITHKLPVLFICDDNDLSILTPTSTRRNWKLTDVAMGLGLPTVDIADDPWTILEQVSEFQNNLPAFINIYSCRKNWHVGIGTDGPPEWDRFDLVTKDMKELGLSKQAKEIREHEMLTMEQLWAV